MRLDSYLLPLGLALSTILGPSAAPALAQDFSGAVPIGAAAGGNLWEPSASTPWPGADAFDWIGRSSTRLGDLNSDGRVEFALGASRTDPQGVEQGAVWIVGVDPLGEALPLHPIGSGSGGFVGALGNGTRFGCALTTVGDLDGNGVVDLAVGARFDGTGGSKTGAVWLLFLDADARVLAETKISADDPLLAGVLDDEDRFGAALTFADSDGDGQGELFVGAPYDGGAGPLTGAVWRLRLDPSGNLLTVDKWGAGAGGIGGVLQPNSLFGRALANLGDLNNDGRDDLAVGAFADDDGGLDSGAVWICFGADDGGVQSLVKWSSTGDSNGDGAPGPESPFPGGLQPGDHFGRSLAALGDIDADGRADLAIGADWDDTLGPDAGAVWICTTAPDGTCESATRLSQGSLPQQPLPGAGYGFSLSNAGDLNGDGVPEILVGLFGADGIQTEVGACLWIPLVGVPLPEWVGCAASDDSLVNVSGGPALGESWTLAVHDPTGSTTPGALSLWLIGAGWSAVSGPCGLPLPGVLALGGDGAGEWLIDPAQPFELSLGLPWAGSPLERTFNLPVDPSLIGASLGVQAALADALAVRASRGIRALVGP